MTIAQENVVLTPHQQLAFNGLMEFVDSDVIASAVLEGFAGCGKTTLTGKLLEILQERRYRIAASAPTHKAKTVLASRVPGIESHTIHALLGLKAKQVGGGRTVLRPEGLPSIQNYDFVVVDECSMMSIDLLEYTYHLKGQTKILFVGDPAQLPPIGEEGSRSRVFSDVQHKVRLSEIVRQAADNPIIAMTMVMRQAIEEQRQVTLEEIEGQIPPGATKAGVMRAGVMDDGARIGVTEIIIGAAVAATAAGVDCRILAWTNARVCYYNSEIHERLYGGSDDDCEFSPGERLIAQTEFRAHDNSRVYTSEEVKFLGAERSAMFSDDGWETLTWLARLERDDGSIVHATIPHRAEGIKRYVDGQWAKWRNLNLREGAERNQSAKLDLSVQKNNIVKGIMALESQLANLRHTYAITAHKAQGSTYHTVFVDWENLSGMKDHEVNQALYVACTRASDHMAIVAP